MENWIVAGLLGVIGAALTALMDTAATLHKQLLVLNRQVRQIATKVGVEESPLDAELRDLLARGNKLQAIKKVREELGLSLRAAKDYVDALS